jgi:hypothetical protein
VRRRWTAFWQVHAFRITPNSQQLRAVRLGCPLLRAVTTRRAAWCRSRVRHPTSDHDPMCARPQRGNVVRMMEVCEPTKQVRRDVFVRSPRRGGLTRLLTGMGATVLAEPGPGLSVTGMDACRIASVAAAHYIPIQELTLRSTSLADAQPEISQTR